MQLMTYNELLTELCDNLDALLSTDTPRKIARTNTNIIYLLLKAIAKGYEIINNICVVLSNKFDPASCSEDDLESVADLVGTDRMLGSASGLYITATNKTEVQDVIARGFYVYKLDDDISFKFEVLENTIVAGGDSVTFFAFSVDSNDYDVDLRGQYPVTAQSTINVEPIDAGVTLSANFGFSCDDNSALLGTVDETNVEFRKRILTDTTRQDSLSELRANIKKQPYVFDTELYFNNTAQDTTVDGITVPPYNMVIFYEGAPRNELASVIAEKSIFPTVATADSISVYYRNSVFADANGYVVNLVPFKRTNYNCEITYTYDATFVAKVAMQNELEAKLLSYFRSHLHKDFITEADIFNYIETLNIENVEILNVDLSVGGVSVPYVEVPISRIPYLEAVTFNGSAR